SPAAPVGVPPGTEQVVSLKFSPLATGPVNGVLNIDSNDTAKGRQTVTLTGVGLPAGPAPAPRGSSLAAASLKVGSPRFNLTVNGTNFTTASVVNWNGSPRPTVFVNNTLLRGSIAPEDVASPATVNVTVVNPAPGGGSSNALPVAVNPGG